MPDMGFHYIATQSTRLHDMSRETTGMNCTRIPNKVTCELCLEILNDQNLHEWVEKRWGYEFFGKPDPVLSLRSQSG